MRRDDACFALLATVSMELPPLFVCLLVNSAKSSFFSLSCHSPIMHPLSGRPVSPMDMFHPARFPIGLLFDEKSIGFTQ
jgi:hypothetical protein